MRLRNGQEGVIRHLGAVHWALGDYAGVELDSPFNRGHEGTVGAVNYFTTARPKHGIFVRPSDVESFEPPPPGQEIQLLAAASPPSGRGGGGLGGSPSNGGGGSSSVGPRGGARSDAKNNLKGSMWSRSVKAQKHAALAGPMASGSTSGAGSGAVLRSSSVGWNSMSQMHSGSRFMGGDSGINNFPPLRIDTNTNTTNNNSNGADSSVPLRVHTAQVARYEAEIAELRARLTGKEAAAISSISAPFPVSGGGGEEDSSLGPSTGPPTPPHATLAMPLPLPPQSIADEADDVDPALLMLYARPSTITLASGDVFFSQVAAPVVDSPVATGLLVGTAPLTNKIDNRLRSISLLDLVAAETALKVSDAAAVPIPSSASASTSASARSSFTYWGSRRGAGAALPPPPPPPYLPVALVPTPPSLRARPFSIRELPSAAKPVAAVVVGTTAPATLVKKVAPRVLVSRPHPKDVAHATAAAAAVTGIRAFVGGRTGGGGLVGGGVVRSTKKRSSSSSIMASPLPPPAPPRSSSLLPSPAHTHTRSAVVPVATTAALSSPPRADPPTPALPKAALMRFQARQTSSSAGATGVTTLTIDSPTSVISATASGSSLLLPSSSKTFQITPAPSVVAATVTGEGTLQSPGFAVPPSLGALRSAGLAPSPVAATVRSGVSPLLPLSPVRPGWRRVASASPPQLSQRQIYPPPPALPQATSASGIFGSQLFAQMQRRRTDVFPSTVRGGGGGGGSNTTPSLPPQILVDTAAEAVKEITSTVAATATATEMTELITQEETVQVSGAEVVERLRAHFNMLRAEAAQLEAAHIETAQRSANSPPTNTDRAEEEEEEQEEGGGGGGGGGRGGNVDFETEALEVLGPAEATPIAAPGPPMRRKPPPPPQPMPPLPFSPSVSVAESIGQQLLPPPPRFAVESLLQTQTQFSPSPSLSPASVTRRQPQPVLSSSPMPPEVKDAVITEPSGRAFVRAYAGVCERGWQPAEPEKPCQDMTVMLEHGPSDGVFLGVFDGHGVDGALISALLRDEVARVLFASPKLEEWILVADNVPAPGSTAEEIEIASILRGGPTGGGAPPPASRQTARVACGEPRLRRNVAGALREALSAAEKILLARRDINSALAGSTACLAFACDGDHLTLVNVGDSRAMLLRRSRSNNSSDGILTPIGVTVDHKPNLPGETKRILLAGGRVKALSYPDGADGPYRVWLGKEDSPGLAMSRSMGDTVGKRAGVSSEPDVYTTTLSPGDDAFLVIASDGLWDVMGGADVADVVQCAGEEAAARMVQAGGDDSSQPQQLQLAVEALANEANKRWQETDDCIDDISIVIAEIGVQVPMVMSEEE